MKSLRYLGEESCEVVDTQVPAIGDRDVLVAARSVGICHSDLELLAGRYIIPFTFPVTPGHEWSGEVVGVGKSVRGFDVGDRVVGECVLGETEHFGFTTDGAMAEFFLADPNFLHKVPDSISHTNAALIETFTVAYYALIRVGRIDASDVVAVLGAGPVGLMAIAAARAMGATVVAVEPVESRREAARRLGADHAVAPETATDEIKAINGGNGPTVVVEASGNPRVMAYALDLVGYAGRIAFIGIDVGGHAAAALGQIQAKALTLTGTRGGPGIWPEAIRFIERTGIDLSSLVTERFAMEDAARAVETSRDSARNVKIHVESTAVLTS